MRTKHTLDLLAAMSDQWNTTTANILDLALAAMMIRQGVTHTVIRPDDFTKALADYKIEREVISTPQGTAWTVRLVPRQPSDQMELPDA